MTLRLGLRPISKIGENVEKADEENDSKQNIKTELAYEQQPLEEDSDKNQSLLAILRDELKTVIDER